MTRPNLTKPSRLQAIKQFLMTEKGIIAACLLAMASIFYLAWGGMVLAKSSVSLCFIALGVKYVWDDRSNLSSEIILAEEKILGYIFASLGITLFFFYRSSTSFQYLAFVLALSGFALVLWGSRFLVRHWFACLLIVVGLYPNIIFVGNKIWRVVTPPFLLENLMGRLGGGALNLIGQPAIVDTRFILIGDGAVEVAPGCSGFDMALPMACIGLLMGLFFKQPWYKTLLAIVLGIFLALLINIPRVMLLAYVVGHHDEGVFKFWHGPWGGQVFMAILMTPYYYLVMSFFSENSSKKTGFS